MIYSLNIRRGFLGVLTLMFLSACERSLSTKPEVTGQIFIILENRETLKLSLTNIDVITAETANNIVHDLTSRRNEAIQLPALQETVDRYSLSSSKRMSGMKFFQEMQKRNQLFDKKFKTHLESDAGTRNQQEIARMEEKVAADSVRFRQATLLSGYSNSLNFSAQSEMTTDAEGKFSLPMSGTERILFVATSRKLIGTAEHYCWIVQVPAGSSNVLLTNKNMIDTDSPENFAREAYLRAPKEPSN